MSANIMILNGKRVVLLKEKGHFPTAALVGTGRDQKRYELMQTAPLSSAVARTRVPRYRGYDCVYPYVPGLGFMVFGHPNN